MKSWRGLIVLIYCTLLLTELPGSPVEVTRAARLRTKKESTHPEVRMQRLGRERIADGKNIPEVNYKNQVQNFRLWIAILIGGLLISTGSLVIVWQTARIKRERFRLWKRELKLAHEFDIKLANSELIALKAQMNPHFIFNSLNSINRYIIKSDVANASSYLTRFSKLIRLVLENSMTLKISLAKELEGVELYLQMESMRFDHKFDYSIDVSPSVDVEKIEVFPLIMQPYVENAIWHGLMNKTTGKGYIHIRVEKQGNYLLYIIEDNGIGRKKAIEIARKSNSQKKSFGLQITQERLRLLAKESGEDMASVETIDLMDNEGEACGTKVTIKTPLPRLAFRKSGNPEKSPALLY